MQSFLLKAGYVATLTTDANSVSKYSIIKDPNNVGVGPVALSASASTLVGPYTKDKRIKIDEIGSPVAISIEFLDGASFLSNLSTAADLVALGEANLADIGNTATGTEIATAVNGILAILVAAGLMDAGA